MLRTIIFIPAAIINTVVFATAAILVGIFNPYSKIIHGFIMRTWSKIILIFAGAKMQISGKENIEIDNSYIVVSNHQSFMDIPILDACLPLYLTFITKKELFKIPIFGWGLSAAGMLKIDRSDRSRSIKTLNEAEKTIFKNGLSVLAFPEGTRSKDGEIHSFKRGPFVMAINTGIPILPVSLKGTFDIQFKNNLRIKTGKVAVIIHKPVITENYTLEQRSELVDLVHKKISAGFYEQAQQLF